MRKNLTIGLLALSAVVPFSALATLQETFNLGSFVSEGLSGTPGFSSTFNSTGGYTLTRMRLSGTLTQVDPGTFASEARIRFTAPNGAITTWASTGPANATWGTFNYSQDLSISQANAFFDPAGMWTFDAFESFNDAGNPDSNHSNVVLEFFDDPVTPPTSTDLGIVADTTPDYNTADRSATHTGGAVTWYKFTVADISDGLGTFLDIDTAGSAIGDTEIGLYNSDGFLLGSDDDDGPGLLSALSYGDVDPVRGPIGNGAGGNGRDGALSAGTYYLAVAQFNASFGSANFNVSTNGTNTTDPITVNFRTNAVPEPATMALLSFGAAVLVARRRKKA